MIMEFSEMDGRRGLKEAEVDRRGVKKVNEKKNLLISKTELLNTMPNSNVIDGSFW